METPKERLQGVGLAPRLLGPEVKPGLVGTLGGATRLTGTPESLHWASTALHAQAAAFWNSLLATSSSALFPLLLFLFFPNSWRH